MGSGLWYDLRLAVRGLWRSPLFSLLAIGTLAFGIGASSAMFAVVDGALIRPLPYPEAESIFAVQTRFMDEGRQSPRLTGGDWEDLRTHSAFESSGIYTGGEIGVQVAGSAEFTATQFVTPGFFDVFGLAPQAGRTLRAGDASAGAVVASSFAVRHFGSAAAAIGRPLTVDGTSYEVVGVMPVAFRFPERTEVWLGIAETPANRSRTAYNYRGVARLAPGVSRPAAQAQLDALAKRLSQAHGDFPVTKSFALVGLRELAAGSTRKTLLLLMGAVLLLLLVACVNVASLFLARATQRTREMAVRGALGASRWSVLRYLLVEGLLVAGSSALAGTLLAYWFTIALAPFVPLEVLRFAEIHIDWRTVAFAIAVSAASAVLFSLAPAWQAVCADLRASLATGASRSVLGGRLGWLRGGLVVTEVGVALVLALSAGVLFRSMLALQEVDLGVRTENLLVMYAHEPAQSKEDYIRVARAMSRLPNELAEIPGVRSAASVMGLPAGQYGSNGSYVVVGKHSWDRPERLPAARFSLASPGYFSTAGIPLTKGRDFQEADLYDQPFVAIISESLARESFAGEDPIGQKIVCGLDSPTPMTIIGVVKDVRHSSPAAPLDAHLYMPLAQHPYFANEVQVILRTAVDPLSVSASLREWMHKRNPAVSTKFTTMADMVSQTVELPRFRMMLGLLFAGIVLFLAATGIYGVMAYLAALRTGEMGLRQALGARATQLGLLFLRNAAKLAGAGLLLGGAVFLLVSRAMEQMVFGVKAIDPVSIAVVLAILVAVVFGAAALPALRAARVDPSMALRD